MIIITLHNFSPDFSNTRFNHQNNHGLHLVSSYLK